VSSIAQALQEANRTGGAGLQVPKTLATMPKDLRKPAEALLASGRSDRAVAEAFTDDGYPISENAVRNYRRTHRLHRFAS
jgi:hypothetical protein